MTRTEIIVLVALALVLLVARRLMDFTNNRGTASRSGGLGFDVWLAQGFGVGVIPVAPGTFGSILGLGWCACLLATRSGWWFLAGTLAGLALSVWLCGTAERALGKKDPSSVVLDEISSIPVCFLWWVFLRWSREGSVPGNDLVFSGRGWWMVLAIFAAFRFFDVVKPWPVRQSQALPGGWGITVDDLLAAAYVNLLFLALRATGALLPGF